MDAHQPETKRLRRDVEGALRRALDPTDVLPLLHRLARAAPDGSEESLFAHRQLAEVLVERHPWRATLHARRAIAASPNDDRAWAILALCQTMLGNYRYAVSAYHHALTSAPNNPWYAHNLGHLLDVALGRASDGLIWLRSAYTSASENTEIATSFAHALARAGKVPEAKRVLWRAMKRGASREQTAVWSWLEQGAPPEKGLPTHPRPTPTMSSPSVTAEGAAAEAGGPSLPAVAPVRRRAARKVPAGALEAILARGLHRLPLDAKQRERALALARDAVSEGKTTEAGAGTDGAGATSADLASLAAAVAYAIVYMDHVPLTQGEVGACFRVSAASVRGRFRLLRASLDIAQADALPVMPRRR